MELSSKNRRTCRDRDVGRDRLSEMPDDVIIHILSFLSTHDAVKTVLLRRFRNLWTLVPTLNFDIYEFFHMENMDEYLSAHHNFAKFERFHLFIHSALMLHQRLPIEKFRLHVDSNYDDGSIAKWLRFALDRQANEIRYHDTRDDYVYGSSLPPNFTSQFLVTLELDDCTLDPEQVFNLGSLKKLSLKRVVMCEDTLQGLLSGCPSLQELSITHPRDIDELTFSVPSNIQILSLDLTFEYHFWKLDLPNVKRLDLNINGILDIIDVSYVQDVRIRCCGICRKDKAYKRFTKYFGKFKGIEAFQLDCVGSQLFLHSLKDLHLSQIRWKHVVLELPRFCERCLLGIRKLLRHLEDLEELILRTPLRGTKELEFVKRVSSFRKASRNASVIFVSSSSR